MQKTNSGLPIKCLCVHGKCRKGESTCEGPCERGWSGKHCDTPSAEKLKSVIADVSRDFTRDGLYRPKQISEDRKTGGDLDKNRKVGETRKSISDDHEHSSVNLQDKNRPIISRPKRIDDDSSSVQDKEDKT